MIITFFLPLSQCGINKSGVEPALVAGENYVGSASPKITQSISNENSGGYYNIPYEMFSTGDLSSWPIFFSFFWPLPFLIYSYFGRRQVILAGLTMVEPFVVVGSGYMVWAISTFGDILFAGYLALAAILSYFVTSCYDNYILIYSFIKKKRGEQDAGAAQINSS